MENDGTTEIILKKRCYTWEIINFTLLSKSTGSALQSPSFSLSSNNKDFMWHLLLYPNGMNSHHADSISLEVTLEKSKQLPLNAEITLSTIVDSSTKRIYREKHVFTRNEETFGCVEFMKHYPSQFDDPKFWEHNIENGNLKIKCEITVVVDILTSSKDSISTSGMEVDLNLLSKDFHNLWTNETLSDFKIIVGNENFSVHKNILAARSQVFEAAFKHNMKEMNDHSMKLDDVDSDVVKEMLRFIYTGKAENLDVVAFELYKLADVYQLEKLKEMCEGTLVKKVFKDNAVDLLIQSEIYQIKNLKERALSFISENINSFIDNEKFKPLHNSPNHFSLYNEIMRTVASNCHKKQTDSSCDKKPIDTLQGGLQPRRRPKMI